MLDDAKLLRSEIHHFRSSMEDSARTIHFGLALLAALSLGVLVALVVTDVSLHGELKALKVQCATP